MGGRIAVVDAQNRFMRWEQRAVIHQQRLVHRSIHVLVFDSADRLVIQRRHHGKDTYPGHWDASVAGHVEESDYLAGPDDDLDAVYEQVAGREMAEELGIVVPTTLLGHIEPVPDIHYEQMRLFRAESDGPFTLQESEVEELKHVTSAELVALAQVDRVTDALLWLRTWLCERDLWA